MATDRLIVIVTFVLASYAVQAFATACGIDG
ncbi:MAG: hypothetical protein QOF33_2090 [Thermomicrobiales bacterium]|jgi:hypothetical protein|nr:hypothetical protein [Thermomicrobiales bacterium]